MRKATGEYIAFLDSDDYWFDTKLRNVLDTLKSNDGYDVVCTDEVIGGLDITNSSVLRYGPYTKNFYKTLLIYGNCLSTSAVILRKSFLENNNLKLMNIIISW